jgi:acetolactate synthase regulatory subunit
MLLRLFPIGDAHTAPDEQINLLVSGQRPFAVLDHRQAPATQTAGIKNPPKCASQGGMAGIWISFSTRRKPEKVTPLVRIVERRGGCC